MRWKLFVLLSFNFLMAFLDSVGLLMFIPLLNVADGDQQQYSGTNGRAMNWVIDFFHALDIPLTVYAMLIVIAIIFILKGVAKYYSQYFQALTLENFSRKIRKDLINGLTDLSYKEFVSTDVGKIQNSMTVEAEHVATAGGYYLETIKSGMLVFVYVVFAFSIDWKFTGFVVVGGALTNVVYKRFYTKTKNFSREITKSNHIFDRILLESVTHFKYLKASGRNKEFGARLTRELNTWISKNIHVDKLNAELMAIKEPMMILIVCAVIAAQEAFFDAHISSIVIILLLFYRAMTYILEMQTMWNSFLAKFGSLEHVQSFTKFLVDHSEPENGEIEIDRLQQICLRNVGVSFGEIEVLKSVNLNIAANQSIAFVGESGAGKSTLVNVLCTVLECDHGEYLVNGIPIGKLNRNHFKAKIGYIPQEPTIFNADVFDNVTFWDTRTPENLKKFFTIMKECSMEVFLDNLPNGYESLLGNNGMNISGGQKQRISIARELYKSVQLLIMDEATSALDSETENEIKESLDALQGSLTIISIAHRLSTVRRADQIYLMDKGQIVAQGDFEELKNDSTFFRRLSELQGL